MDKKRNHLILFAVPLLVLALTFGIVKWRSLFPARVDTSIKSSSKITFYYDKKDISIATKRLSNLLKKYPRTREFRVYRLNQLGQANGLLIYQRNYYRKWFGYGSETIPGYGDNKIGYVLLPQNFEIGAFGGLTDEDIYAGAKENDSFHGMVQHMDKRHTNVVDSANTKR